ncbi:MAG: apolipoprotein N-acyltransferase, partial [Phycisphaerae bacterium]
GRAPSQKQALLDGFFWGWGYFVAGLYWFTIALLTEPEKFAWLIPFALFGLTAVIALYPALAAWLYFRLRRPGLPGVLLFAGIWTWVEFARGHWFTGFPWNLAGYAMAASDASL